MVDYQKLKDADAALGIADPVAAAAALNAQATQGLRDIPCTDARSVLLATGEYGALVMLSRRDPSSVAGDGKPPAGLVAAAITAIATLDHATVIQATDDGKWAAAQQMLGAFVQSGVVTKGSADEISALRILSIPVWPVVLTEHDVTGARGL